MAQNVGGQTRVEGSQVKFKAHERDNKRSLPDHVTLLCWLLGQFLWRKFILELIALYCQLWVCGGGVNGDWEAVVVLWWRHLFLHHHREEPDGQDKLVLDQSGKRLGGSQGLTTHYRCSAASC